MEAIAVCRTGRNTAHIVMMGFNAFAMKPENVIVSLCQVPKYFSTNISFWNYTCSKQGSCLDNPSNIFMANGYCNDEINNGDCNFDGGDCCTTEISMDYCDQCQCHV